MDLLFADLNPVRLKGIKPMPKVGGYKYGNVRWDVLGRLLHVFKNAKELDEGWYWRARSECEVIARETGKHINVVAAVVSCLSVGCEWERNLSDAAHLCLWENEDAGYGTYRKQVKKAIKCLKVDLSIVTGKQLTTAATH